MKFYIIKFFISDLDLFNNIYITSKLSGLHEDL